MVVFFELMISKAVPSGIFLLLLIIPLLSCSGIRDSSPVTKALRKQFFITAVDIAIDMVVGVIVWNASQLTSACFYLIGATVQNILLAMVFADWKRRVMPWKITKTRRKPSTIKFLSAEFESDDIDVFDNVSLIE